MTDSDLTQRFFFALGVFHATLETLTDSDEYIKYFRIHEVTLADFRALKTALRPFIEAAHKRD